MIWRNLNIVDLRQASAGVTSASVALYVTNPDRENRIISLVIRSQGIRDNPSFLAVGQVSVEFDDALLKAWRQGGGRGTGFEIEGNRAVITDPDSATFENLVFPYGREGQLMLTFYRLPDTLSWST